MKRVAILQSNYIPWKGYFDLIAAVDEFILYDDAQYTKQDWRNRNRIKTSNGLLWLSVPVGSNIARPIREVEIPDSRWQESHWKSISGNYRRAPYFDEVSGILQDIYLRPQFDSLSVLNRTLLQTICDYLGIRTVLSNSWDYDLVDGKTEKLLHLCQQAGAGCYVSGPAARDYLDEAVFQEGGVDLSWFDYSGYPEYPQLWGGFVHEVSIIDLLFNCGPDSANYMRYLKS